MAIKTRTSRTSSGINAERKVKRAQEQSKREDSNLSTLSDLSGERFLQNAKGERVRPSKALRKAQRARRFASRGVDSQPRSL